MRLLKYIVGTVLKSIRPNSTGDVTPEAEGESGANQARNQERQALRRRARRHSPMNGLLVR